MNEEHLLEHVVDRLDRILYIMTELEQKLTPKADSSEPGMRLVNGELMTAEEAIAGSKEPRAEGQWPFPAPRREHYKDTTPAPKEGEGS